MPGAQPADLPGQPTLDSIFSPPGQATMPGQQTLGQYFAGAGATVPGIPTGQQPQQPMPAPQPNAPTPGGPQRSPADALDQFGSAFQGPPPDQGGQPQQPQEDPLDQFAGAFTGIAYQPKKGEVYDDSAPLSWGEEWPRIKASLGRSPREVASVLSDTYGEGNVRINKDKVYFRKPGEAKFRALDPKQFEFFGDLIADMAGNMVEAAGAAPYEYLGGLGARASASTGTPMGVAGAMASGSAGFYYGAKAGLNLREYALGKAGGQIDPTLNEDDEFKKSLMTNVATAGVGKVVGDGIGKIAGALAESPIMRLKTIAKVQSVLEDMANAYRIGRSTTPEGTGQEITNVVRAERARLNMIAKEAREPVVTAAGDQKFSAGQTLAQLRNVIRNEGGTIDKNGVAKIAGEMESTKVPIERQYDRMSPVLGPDGKPMITQELRNETVTIPGGPVPAPISPMGTKEGKGELQEIVDMYNDLMTAQRSSGGVDAATLFKIASDTGERGEYGTYTVGGKTTTQAAKKLTQPWQAINSGAIADRDAAAMTVLPADSMELAQYKMGMKRYAARIEPLKKLEEMVNKAADDGSLPTLANSIIHPERPQAIRDFKAMLGTSPTNDIRPDATWETVRGSWLSTLMNSPAVKDPTSGLMSGKRLMSTLDRYGEDVLKEVFPGGLGDMRRLALKLDSVYKQDLKPSAMTQAFIEAEPVIDKLISSRSIANFLWGITHQRAELADALLNDGFMKMYRDAAPQNRAKLMKAMDMYQEMYDQSFRTNLAKGWDSLVIPSSYLKKFGLPMARGNLAGAGQGLAREAGATMKDAKDTVKGAKGVLYDALGYDPQGNPKPGLSVQH